MTPVRFAVRVSTTNCDGPWIVVVRLMLVVIKVVIVARLVCQM